MTFALRGALIGLTTGLILSQSACIDLIPAEQPPFRTATLHLTLQLGEALADRPNGEVAVRVYGAFDPGVDERGVLRRTVSDTVRIGGVSILPAEYPGRGQRLYDSMIQLSHDALERPIAVLGPRVETLIPPEPVAFHWPVLFRVGEATVTAQPGSDVLLRTAASIEVAEPEPTFQRWSISLFRGLGWSSLGADEPPPETVSLAAPLLGAEEGARIAILNTTRMATFPFVPAVYSVRVEMTQSIRWTVILRPTVHADEGTAFAVHSDLRYSRAAHAPRRSDSPRLPSER